MMHDHRLIWHPVIHESTVPGAPPDLFQAGTVKTMHELVSELLIRERGVLGFDRVSRALDSKNLPTERDRFVGSCEEVCNFKCTRLR